MKIDFMPQLNRNPLMLAGMGLGAIGSICKFLFGSKQRREGKRINPVFNQYQANPFAKQQLGIAQQLFNGRMAGAPQLERNIMASGANFNANVGRNATDGSQALALAAAGQGQTNQSFQDLQTQEQQNKYGMLQNLNNAYGVNIQEGDKEYNSMLQKFKMDTEQKNALLGGGAQNQFGAFGDLASLGIQAGQYFDTKKTGTGNMSGGQYGGAY